ncbi:MAG: Hsp70 family protein [Actinophytocola sp.]|uniref:Hsp70 family protein n=1 Tax=Actinophytocola sp. TaxID=1872138 RepID=UPI003D6A1D29
MRYGVGIDLGTSFTSAAVLGPEGARMVPLSRQVVVPSVVYADHDGTVLTGLAAEQAAARGGELGRVARGFKRRIGDPTPLVLGGTAYSPDALMAAQLRDVLECVTQMESGPPEVIVLTCPAIWGPYRREHFEEVPRLAGVPTSHVLTEPEAVATHYSMERRLGEGEIVAVYDLGGGTFDTTILRIRADGMEILGTPEGIEHMGGMDFDETLLAHVDERLGGAVSALNQADPRDTAALAYIRALCVRAKEELSIEPDVQLTIPLPSGPRQVMITRLQLNDMLRPSVRQTTEALRRTIASAGLRPDDVSAMLLAGGSSRIPLVDQLVSEEFGRPVRLTLHPKFTVALGGAVTADRVRTASKRAAAPDTQSAQPPPAAPPSDAGTGSAPAVRRNRRVPVLAAVVAVIAVVVAYVTLFTGEPQQTAGDSGTTESTTASGPPKSMQVYGEEGPVPPYTSFIASAENWAGVDISGGVAKQTAITALPDDKGNLRVTWAGGAPGQVYMQNPTDTADMAAYVENGGLVFDAVVHAPPKSLVTVAVHCVYPCAAEVEATKLFRGLPRGKRTTVTIPLSCFTDKGLKPATVNTPFLVYTTGALDVTFSDIRWEPDVNPGPPANRCGNLK